MLLATYRDPGGGGPREGPLLFATNQGKCCPVLALAGNRSRKTDRKLHHTLVRGAWRNLRDRHHIVPDSAEGPHDGEVTALIRQESRRSALRALAAAPSGGLHDHRLLVTDRVRSVANGGLDIVPREARVGVQHIRLGSTFARPAWGPRPGWW